MRALLLALLVACGDPPVPRTPFILVDHAGWTRSDADPYDVPATSTCAPGGVLFEGSAPNTILEIESDLCDYAALSNTTLDALLPGDRVDLVFWHLALISPNPAEAHVALSIGGHTALEHRIAIPGDENILETKWEVPAAVPAGAPMFFHFHNHGENAYRLGRILVTPP